MNNHGVDMDVRIEYLRRKAEESLTGVPMRLREHPQDNVWFWRPSWYWFGWGTLLPITRGHDEYSRETIVLGWTVTGRVIIALGYCGDTECYEQSLRWIDYGDDVD